MTSMRPERIDEGLEQYGDLVNYWYPVAWSSDVNGEPLAVELLGTPVVVWRSNEGIAAFYDLCIHRGTPLSLGRVSAKGELICAYHGWHYAGSGACTWIPSREPDRPIPSKAMAAPFHVEERYGLVWVCLGNPKYSIPEFPPEFEADDYFGRGEFEDTWRCNAARFIENMMDTSHFAWVHPGILGTPEKPIVPPIDVRRTESGLAYVCEEPMGHMVEPDAPHIRAYELTLPFMILFRTHQPGRDEGEVIWYICSPVDTKHTRFFYFIRRNFVHPMPEEERMHLTRTLQEQDRLMVEAQRPEELPLDLREELHLRGPDDVALQYRKLLLEMGVDWA